MTIAFSNRQGEINQILLKPHNKQSKFQQQNKPGTQQTNLPDTYGQDDSLFRKSELLTAHSHTSLS